MNDRINELMQTARNWAVSASNTDEHLCLLGSDYFQRIEKEKFAELIVRECAQKGFAVFDEEPDAPASELQYLVHNNILKHFLA